MNGFYPVLNEIHDKAVRDLPLAECALFEHLWRKLIGWNKWSDDIAISQLDEEMAGGRATILRLLKKLETKRWIIVTRANGITNHIGIPKCPGIKMRLGIDPYQNDTGSRIKMILVPVSECDGDQYQNDTHNRQLLQTSPKDTFTDHHTTSNIVTKQEGAENENQDGGDGMFSTSEKTEVELRDLDDKLRYHQVRNPNRGIIANKYDTRYIHRQILQIKKDFDKGTRFDNPGGALVARIKSGHVTEDYPE